MPAPDEHHPDMFPDWEWYAELHDLPVPVRQHPQPAT